MVLIYIPNVCPSIAIRTGFCHLLSPHVLGLQVAREIKPMTSCLLPHQNFATTLNATINNNRNAIYLNHIHPPLRPLPRLLPRSLSLHLVHTAIHSLPRSLNPQKYPSSATTARTTTQHVLVPKDPHPPLQIPRQLPHNRRNNLRPPRTQQLQSRPPTPLHPTHILRFIAKRELGFRRTRRHERCTRSDSA